MKNKIHIRYSVIIFIILIAAFSRLLPHPSNFAPLGAMALFGSVHFSKRLVSVLIPVISMWISDLLINNWIYGEYFDHFIWFYPGFYWTYGSFALIALFGSTIIKEVNTKRVILGSISASLAFYLFSNFGVWISTGMYAQTLNGLATCYIAGLPFFKNTLAGDLVYSGLMFGCFEILSHRFPVLAGIAGNSMNHIPGKIR